MICQPYLRPCLSSCSPAPGLCPAMPRSSLFIIHINHTPFFLVTILLARDAGAPPCHRRQSQTYLRSSFLYHLPYLQIYSPPYETKQKHKTLSFYPYSPCLTEPVASNISHILLVLRWPLSPHTKIIFCWIFSFVSNGVVSSTYLVFTSHHVEGWKDDPRELVMTDVTIFWVLLFLLSCDSRRRNELR